MMHHVLILALDYYFFLLALNHLLEDRPCLI